MYVNESEYVASAGLGNLLGKSNHNRKNLINLSLASVGFLDLLFRSKINNICFNGVKYEVNIDQSRSSRYCKSAVFNLAG